jgi:hypothetical protein
VRGKVLAAFFPLEKRLHDGASFFRMRYITILMPNRLRPGAMLGHPKQGQQTGANTHQYFLIFKAQEANTNE